MNIILSFLGTLFGFKSGATVANTVTGVANWAALGTGAVYVLNHSDMQIPLGTVSLGALSLAGVIVFAFIEAVRRVAPGAGGQ